MKALFCVILDFLAGVKEKDEVLEVNGTDISMLRLHDVRKLLLGPAGLVLALCAGFSFFTPTEWDISSLTTR